jgi:hypothetical protein
MKLEEEKQKYTQTSRSLVTSWGINRVMAQVCPLFLVAKSDVYRIYYGCFENF